MQDSCPKNADMIQFETDSPQKIHPNSKYSASLQTNENRKSSSRN